MDDDRLGVCVSWHDRRCLWNHLMLINASNNGGARNTNHDAVSQDGWSRILLVGKLCHKVVADRSVLPQLLLQPFRIPLEVLQKPVVCCHDKRRYVGENSPQLHAVATLMRSSHEQNSMC